MPYSVDGKILREIGKLSTRFERWRTVKRLWRFVWPILAIGEYAGLFLGVAAVGFLPFTILHAVGISPATVVYRCIAICWLAVVVACCCWLGLSIYRYLLRRRFDLEMLVCFCGLILSVWVGASIMPLGWYA